jgi:hypothetical protein
VSCDKPRRIGRYAILLVTALVTGCSTFNRNDLADNSAAVPTPRVRLTYRTDSGRLNLASQNMRAAVQPASYAAPQTAALPPHTVSIVDIQYPHPGGRADCALVTVVFEAGAEDDASPFDVSTLWNRIAGGGSEGPSTSNVPFREEWVTEIPKWHLETQIEKLKRSRFFRREKALSPQAFVAVETDGKHFGKKYRALPELDALILRIRQEGRLVSRSGAAAASFAAHPAAGHHASMRRLPDVLPSRY